MKDKKAKTSGHRVFPRVDRSIVTVGNALDKSDEKAFWLSKTPLDRLEAVEFLRQIAYGYDPTTTRLQRVLEIAEFPMPPNLAKKLPGAGGTRGASLEAQYCLGERKAEAWRAY
jgi:hypothetical protein